MCDTAEFEPIEGSPLRLRTSARVASNDYVEVFMDRVVFPDGREGTHLRVWEPTGGVAVLVQEPTRHEDHALFVLASGPRQGEPMIRQVLVDSRHHGGQGRARHGNEI